MQIRPRLYLLPLLASLCSTWLVVAAAIPIVEHVQVKRTDGKTVSGELLWADPQTVGIQPGKGDPVVVTWKEVASISNGLTRPAAILRWKEKNKDILCSTCNGDQTIKHEACGGTGVDPASKKPCEDCKGSGSAGKCTNHKCVEGKVDCPGPCLKLSVGTWKKEADGKLWRYFRVRAGNRTGDFRISDGHVGQVWVMTADGTSMEEKGPCPICHGAAKVDCSTCLGKGILPCKTCGGVGVVGPHCPEKTCDHGRIPCTTCNGKGLVLRK